MPEFQHLLKVGARWASFIGSVLTFVLGIVHIFDIKARIYWPDGGFIDDTQKVTWRFTLFSLIPELLLENWTPTIFGLVGSAAHFKDFKRLRFVNETFINLFFFNMVEGLFATIAYNGGLGIIFSVVVWVGALLSLILIFWDDDTGSLDLNMRFNMKARNG